MLCMDTGLTLNNNNNEKNGTEETFLHQCLIKKWTLHIYSITTFLSKHFHHLVYVLEICFVEKP